jgi:cytochrome b561
VTDAEGFMTYGTLPPGGYPASSKWLHWLVALSVLTTVPIGLLLPYLAPGPTQDGLYNFHKSLGVVILVLMVLRVINRFAVGAPAAEPGLARWQRAVSSAAHGMLYLLLIVQPIVGYWANSAFGAATPVFGLFQIPAMVATDQVFAERLFALHRWIGILIALLVAMHIGAALQHFLIFRDGVLQRMLPRAIGGR